MTLRSTDTTPPSTTPQSPTVVTIAATDEPERAVVAPLSVRNQLAAQSSTRSTQAQVVQPEAPPTRAAEVSPSSLSIGHTGDLGGAYTIFLTSYVLGGNIPFAGSTFTLFPIGELRTWHQVVRARYASTYSDVFLKADSPDDLARGLLDILAHLKKFPDPDDRPPFEMPPFMRRAQIKRFRDLFCTLPGTVTYYAYVYLMCYTSFRS